MTLPRSICHTDKGTASSAMLWRSDASASHSAGRDRRRNDERDEERDEKRDGVWEEDDVEVSPDVCGGLD